MKHILSALPLLVLPLLLDGGNLWASQVKHCTGDDGASATVVIDGTNVSSMRITAGQNKFDSSNCKPIQILDDQLVSAECEGKWTEGSSDSADLLSADGVLNILQVKLPDQSQNASLFCASVGGL